MNQQSTLTLNALPRESLAALESAVAQHPNWRILAGQENDQPRFIIEKRARYTFIRGWTVTALYQIVGGFQKSKSGETTLHYAVSGQVGVPLFHAAFHVAILLLIMYPLSRIVFDPNMPDKWIGVMLLVVLGVSIVLYAVFAYRSYQGHLSELKRFMEEFAQSFEST